MPLTDPRLPHRSGLLARFRAARGGNVATIFALSSVPLVAFAGAAVDYGLATRLQVKLQAAADATTLTLCQTPNNTLPATLQTQANTTMAGYIPDPTLVVNPLTIVPAGQSTARTIRLTANVNSGTFFGAFTGVTSPTVGAVSKCSTPIPATFEIALVLDNTGSMAEKSNGQTKMAGVQTAAINFIEYVYNSPVFSPQTRISIVPFAGAVSINDPNPSNPNPLTPSNTPWIDWTGKSQYHWKNINQSQANAAGFNSRNDIFTKLSQINPGNPASYPYYGWGWGGCIETPPYPQNVQDVAPNPSQPDTLYQQFFAPDEPGPGTPPSTSTYGFPGLSFYTDGNKQQNLVWNDYIADSGPGCAATTNYRVAESTGCKYASANKSNVRNTSMVQLPTGDYADLGQNGPNWGCASAPMQRLLAVKQGTNKATLEALVNKMTARGSTNLHEGFMWGWRSISPNSVFADGAAYNTPSTPPANAVNKVIVMMTDGMDDWLNLFSNSATTGNGAMYNALGYPTDSNTGPPPDQPGTSANARLQANHQTPAIENGTNNVWDPSPGSGRSAIDGLLAQACTNAKAAPANISIYTVAFSIPGDPIDSTGQGLLQNCASNTNQYFLANSSNQLITAFGQIANSIGALRISQ